MRKKRACIEFDQNFQFFDRPKTGALYFCHMIIGSEQNERVGYEDMSERPGRDRFCEFPRMGAYGCVWVYKEK